MARINLVDNEIIQTNLDQKNKSASNLMRALANNQRICTSLDAFLTSAMKQNSLPFPMVELVIVYIAKQKECEYCLSIHIPIALENGITEQQILFLSHFEQNQDFFSAEMLSILRFAKICLISSQNVQDNDIENLKLFYSDSQIVDIIALICAVFCTTSFNNSLAIDLSQEQNDALKKVDNLL